MTNCNQRVALVTGAAGKGIGRSAALTLARDGFAVVVNYRTSEESARAIVSRIEAGGGQAMAVQADVFDAGDCQRLVDTAFVRFGRLDACIIGPGGGWHPESPDKLDTRGAFEDVEHEIAPIYNLLPLVLPTMYRQRWGRVVGIGLNLDLPSPAFAYNAAKAARNEALLLASKEAWPHGVTINVIGPAPIQELETLDLAVEHCQHGPGWLERTTTSPQDIAEGIGYLCSDAGRFVTGCMLRYSF